MGIPNYDKNQILQQFNQLLAETKLPITPISVKQKQLQVEADQKILEAASTYTIESIVKGLADLQLDFNSRVDDISSKLSTEISKLEELKRAIEIATQQVAELGKIRIAAEALNILIHEHEQKSIAFETESGQKRLALDNEIALAKAAWQKEQGIFEATNKERQERLKKERKKNEADYKYDVERKRKIELDKYEDQKRSLENRLAEESEQRESDWAEREKIIAERRAMLEQNQALAAKHAQELDESVQKAQAEATKEAQKKTALAAELFEKEVAANQEVYELQIKSLEEAIVKQAKQIDDLNAQLQAAVKQSQELAFRTVSSAEKMSVVSDQ